MGVNGYNLALLTTPWLLYSCDTKEISRWHRDLMKVEPAEAGVNGKILPLLEDIMVCVFCSHLDFSVRHDHFTKAGVNGQILPFSEEIIHGFCFLLTINILRLAEADFMKITLHLSAKVVVSMQKVFHRFWKQAQS